MDTPSPNVSIVSGAWQRAASTSEIDLEAQIITGVHAPLVLPVAPERACPAAVPSRTPVREHATAGAIDDFFGVARPRATHESRHDASSHVSVATNLDAPPPYADVSELPCYSAVSVEPVTLAMYLFKFGFLFPPFWVLGALILVSPLRAPADFEPTKPDAERQQLVRTMRDAELRWARRCTWALLVLVVAVGLMAGITVAVLKTGE